MSKITHHMHERVRTHTHTLLPFTLKMSIKLWTAVRHSFECLLILTITDNSEKCCVSTFLLWRTLKRRDQISWPEEWLAIKCLTQHQSSQGATLIEEMTAIQTDKRRSSNVLCPTTSEQVVGEHGKYLCIPLPLKRSRVLENICAVAQDRNRKLKVNRN